MTVLTPRAAARAAALAAVAGALALAPAALAADPPLYGVGTNSNIASATASPTIIVDVSTFITIGRAWEALPSGAPPPPHPAARAAPKKTARTLAARRPKRRVVVRAKARGKVRIAVSARRR